MALGKGKCAVLDASHGTPRDECFHLLRTTDVNTMTKRREKHATKPRAVRPVKSAPVTDATARATFWIIESGTRGVYVGSPYAERPRNWPLFSWSPDPARIVRFDNKEAAEAELTRVQSFAANARLREVE
jgi:hypothetical protein